MKDIRIVNRVEWPEHRSGWKFAIDALEPACSGTGTLFDTFVDGTFSLIPGKSTRWPPTPYDVPWIGVVHNPLRIPKWHEHASAPRQYMRGKAFRMSLGTCKGLITLSSQLGRWVRAQVKVPVASLIHPTASTRCRFSVQRYRATRDRIVVQVGWWLRRLTSIFRLRAHRHRKAILCPVRHARMAEYEQRLLLEAAHVPGSRPDWTSVDRIPYADARTYDALLSRSVVFMHYIDCAASNAIVECAMRDTPMVVNRLPAIEEYLGREYPLFFTSLDEAEAILADEKLIASGHEYLCARSKAIYSAKYFRRSFRESPVVRAL